MHAACVYNLCVVHAASYTGTFEWIREQRKTENDMATKAASRPLGLVRCFLYFVVWVFSLTIFAVIAAKLYRSVFGIKICALSSDGTSLSFCQWGIAAGVIGFVGYLFLDIALILSLFTSMLEKEILYIELVVNGFFILWYLAFAVVMSVGVARYKSLVGSSDSYVNTPAALSWVSFALIILAEILVMVDFRKPSEQESADEPAETEA
jgi:hypothetical protein